jgi:hypothetical protein
MTVTFHSMEMTILNHRHPISIGHTLFNERHSRESGNLDYSSHWIPAFAGMTIL